MIFRSFIGTCGLIQYSSSTVPFFAIKFSFFLFYFLSLVYLSITIYLEIYLNEANEDLVKKLELPTELIF